MGSGSLTARGPGNATESQADNGSLTAREPGRASCPNAATTVGDAAYATGTEKPNLYVHTSVLEWVSDTKANKLMKEEALRSKQRQVELQQALKSDLEKQ